MPFLWCFPCCAPRCPPPAGRGQIASASCASAQMGARARDADGRDGHLRARHTRGHYRRAGAPIRTRRTSPLATARSPPSALATCVSPRWRLACCCNEAGARQAGRSDAARCGAMRRDAAGRSARLGEAERRRGATCFCFGAFVSRELNSAARL